MPAQISTIEALARLRLVETTPRFWSSDELTQIIIAGIRDLWRSIADLKQEHFLAIDTTNVTFPVGSDRLVGLPGNVHKVYNIEAVDLTTNGPNTGLIFQPLDYNHRNFQFARARDPIDPQDDTFYYHIAAEGGPIEPVVIRVAPKTTATIPLSFAYIHTVGDLSSGDVVPIPGESTNALVAWCVAFARAKEADDRAPDGAWLTIYATEKQSLLQSLGLRQYQEPKYADAEFEEYWGWLLPLGISFYPILHILKHVIS